MSFDKYINWREFWNNEVTLEFTDLISDEEKLILEQFKNDNKVNLLIDECNMQILDGDEWEFIFQFSESGGQNEGDTQGWSRDYYITLDENYFLKEVVYEQG